MDVASLVIGIISAVVGFIPCVNVLVFLPALAGLILGIIALRKNRAADLPSGVALTGIILNSLPLIVMLVFVIFAAVTGDANSVSEMTIQ
ncbi:MAG: hypothetical protein B1H09_02255 [Gemmatimonadaceae bacterium 4484_173]|nr:MAG: hypothetical protein B1H09_02255 [Gemmatimonadaceae bacterium 4484_173]RKZ03623.1 MAG: hypothetical protein DRQ21_05355 [Candidatus Fermentibacteria bacterium]